MSLPTVLGFVLSLVLFFGAVYFATDNYYVFLHLTGFLMVVGGTLAGTFVAFEFRYVLQALGMMKSIFFAPRVNRAILTGEVARVIRWGYMVQRAACRRLRPTPRP